MTIRRLKEIIADMPDDLRICLKFMKNFLCDTCSSLFVVIFDGK